jgi:hypothetical protein
MPRIDETEFGLLPTPKASDGDKGSRTTEGAQREMARGKNKDLGMVAKLWPTVSTRGFCNEGDLIGLAKKAASFDEFSGMAYRASQKKKKALWPTPLVRDSRTVAGAKRAPNSTGSEPLVTQVAEAEKVNSGALNPNWVERLMGFPPNWTEV